MEYLTVTIMVIIWFYDLLYGYHMINGTVKIN